MLVKQPKEEQTKIKWSKKIPGDKWKLKHNNPKYLKCRKISSKMEIYSDKSLFCFRKQKIWNKQSDLTPKRTKYKELTKSKVTRRKEIKNTRTEINKTKKAWEGAREKFNQTKSWFLEKTHKTDDCLARLIKKDREGSKH